MSECQLKTKAIKYLKTVPELWFYKSADQFTSGIPDIVICHRGLFKGIELKFGKNKTTPIQDFVGKRIRAAGGFWYVCRSLSEVKEVIQ
jgi:hypothetical protein